MPTFKSPLFGNIAPILQPTAWQKKPIAIRKVTVSKSRASLEARLALSEAAKGTRGMEGHDNVISHIAKDLAGRTHGGMSNDQRRQVRYDMADASIESQRRALGQTGRARRSRRATRE